jgi:hypothetical protein
MCTGGERSSSAVTGDRCRAGERCRRARELGYRFFPNALRACRINTGYRRPDSQMGVAGAGHALAAGYGGGLSCSRGWNQMAGREQRVNSARKYLALSGGSDQANAKQRLVPLRRS